MYQKNVLHARKILDTYDVCRNAETVPAMI